MVAAQWQNGQHNTLTRQSEKKNFAMKLNIRAQSAQNLHNNYPIVLVHGLFGSLDNLGVLARDLVNDYDIIQVDMRNHGLSPRDPVMNYPAMAQDLLDTLNAQHIEKATFIGHSMGKSSDGAQRAGPGTHRPFSGDRYCPGGLPRPSP